MWAGTILQAQLLATGWHGGVASVQLSTAGAEQAWGRGAEVVVGGGGVLNVYMFAYVCMQQ
jgi:hypothetical protein